MAVAFVALGAHSNGAANTSVTVAIPSTAAVGDLLIAVITTNQGAASASTLGTPAGWSFGAATSTAGGTAATNVALFWYYKIAGAADPGSTVTWPTAATTIWISYAVAYSGTSSTPVDVSAQTTGGATSSATYNSPSVSPTGANDLLVVLAGVKTSTAGVANSLSMPAAFTSRLNFSQTSTTVTNDGIGIFDTQLSVSGPTAAYTITDSTAAYWNAAQIAISPAGTNATVVGAVAGASATPRPSPPSAGATLAGSTPTALASAVLAVVAATALLTGSTAGMGVAPRPGSFAAAASTTGASVAQFSRASASSPSGSVSVGSTGSVLRGGLPASTLAGTGALVSAVPAVSSPSPRPGHPSAGVAALGSTSRTGAGGSIALVSSGAQTSGGAAVHIRRGASTVPTATAAPRLVNAGHVARAMASSTSATAAVAGATSTTAARSPSAVASGSATSLVACGTASARAHDGSLSMSVDLAGLAARLTGAANPATVTTSAVVNVTVAGRTALTTEAGVGARITGAVRLAGLAPATCRSARQLAASSTVDVDGTTGRASVTARSSPPTAAVAVTGTTTARPGRSPTGQTSGAATARALPSPTRRIGPPPVPSAHAVLTTRLASVTSRARPATVATSIRDLVITTSRIFTAWVVRLIPGGWRIDSHPPGWRTDARPSGWTTGRPRQTWTTWLRR